MINILGLAIGLCCFLLIILWIQDELSFDRFHENADQIYLTLRSETDKFSAITTRMLAQTVKEEFPEVINATSYIQLPGSFKIFLKHGDKAFDESFGMVDQQFFEIFTFPFTAGDPESAFADPNSLILTARAARKYFGDNNALGESFDMTLFGLTRTLKVGGVVEDIPYNSHITEDIFIPITWVVDTFGLVSWNNWGNHQARTYFLTQPGVNIPALVQKLGNLERSKLPNQPLENIKFSLLPLDKIHLYSGNIEFFTSTGDIKYVYIFAIIGVLLLLIACINYINLSNALSLKRIKEIGIQKVVGAHRSTLIAQHCGETLTITLIALVIALIIAQLFLPILNRMADKSLLLDFSNPSFSLLLILITILTSLVSGLYSAVYISGFNPIQIIKGKLNTDNGGFNLRKGLVIFQFTISLLIILCTLVVYHQLNFIKSNNLGYDREHYLYQR